MSQFPSLSQLLNFAVESLKLYFHEGSAKLAICRFWTPDSIASLSLHFPCVYQRLRSYGPRLSRLWGESCTGLFDCSTTAVNLKKSIFWLALPPGHISSSTQFNSDWCLNSFEYIVLKCVPLLSAQYRVCTLGSLLVCLDAFLALFTLQRCLLE